jgi:hypothetical protein
MVITELGTGRSGVAESPDLALSDERGMVLHQNDLFHIISCGLLIDFTSYFY